MVCFQEDDRIRSACDRSETDIPTGLRCPALDPDLQVSSPHQQQQYRNMMYESSIYVTLLSTTINCLIILVKKNIYEICK